jgi:hypothetical protein
MRRLSLPVLVAILASSSFLADATSDEKQAEKRPLTGIVAGPDGAPVGDAVVRAYYFERGRPAGDPVELTTNAAGEFRIERKPDPVWLYVTASNGALAGSSQPEANDDSVTVKLAPAATVIGRGIENEEPLAGEDIICTLGVSPPEPNGRGLRRMFKVSTFKTANDGRFVLSGLLVGEKYDVRVAGRDKRASIGPQGTTLGSFAHLSTVQIETPGKTDLGYLEVPQAMRITQTRNGALREIDAEELATRRFAVNTDLATRISTAEADAKREQRRVMLVLGDPKSEPSRKLIVLFDVLERAESAGGRPMIAKRLQDKLAKEAGVPAAEIGAEFKRALGGFRRLHVNVNDGAAADYLLQKYKINNVKLEQPVLAVLGADDSPPSVQSFGTAADSSDVGAKLMRDFLKQHAPSPPNATEQLAAALQLARKEDKHVLLQQSRPASYPSRLLVRFIADHHQLFERDFVYVNIDSDWAVQGAEVMEQLRKSPGDVPWLAIVRSDGTKLVDSDGPDVPIGFPSAPEAIDYFIDKMLKPAAQRLTPEQLEELRQALREK